MTTTADCTLVRDLDTQTTYCPTHCAGPACSRRWFYPCCGSCMETTDD